MVWLVVFFFSSCLLEGNSIISDFACINWLLERYFLLIHVSFRQGNQIQDELRHSIQIWIISVRNNLWSSSAFPCSSETSLVLDGTVKAAASVRGKERKPHNCSVGLWVPLHPSGPWGAGVWNQLELVRMVPLQPHKSLLCDKTAVCSQQPAHPYGPLTLLQNSSQSIQQQIQMLTTKQVTRTPNPPTGAESGARCLLSKLLIFVSALLYLHKNNEFLALEIFAA